MNWLKQFNTFCLLNNNHYSHTNPDFELLVAAGEKRSVSFNDSTNSFDALRVFHQQQPAWLFGHLGFGLQEQTHHVANANAPFVDFGKGFFFEPQILLSLKANEVFIEAGENSATDIFKAIESQTPILEEENIDTPKIKTQSEQAYIQAVDEIKNHIKLGDCYELNFCRFFTSENVQLNPYQAYQSLNKISPAPFAAFYKLKGKYCICASPERFIKKEGSKITSQPIKGTAKRNLQNPEADDALKKSLSDSFKERSENIMITDLVRNDLSRIAAKQSVRVQELLGIYSFPQVHQMISTISATLAADKDFAHVLAATFPMGSMTGAPKKKVLELIAQYEPMCRGLFSGSIGFIKPNTDFDFNVVIRSIFYDEPAKRMYFAAGGAITFYSNAENEYHECELKTLAIRQVLGLAK